MINLTFWKVSIALLFCLFTVASFSQKINYSIPENLKGLVSAEDYKTLVGYSIDEVKKKFSIDHVDSASITITAPNGEQIINLDNLIIQCGGEKDKSKWKAIIQDHFNNLFSAIHNKDKLNMNDYDKMKPYLSIRIYPDAVVAKNGGSANLIVRTDLAGTTTVLMLDLPQAFATVTKSEFEKWHQTQDDAFKIALDNISHKKVEKATKVFEIDGAKIEFNFIENEDYAASCALDLGRNLPEFVGDWGTVIVIPNKGFAAICKVSKSEPLDFVKFIQRIKRPSNLPARPPWLLPKRSKVTG